LLVHLVGHWTIHAGAPVVTEVYQQLDTSPPVRRLAFAAQELAAWDSRLLTLLREVLEASTHRQMVVDQQGLPDGVRRFLALAAAVPEREGALPRPLLAQTPWTPDVALRALMAGNERFDTNQLTSVEHDLRMLKEHTVEKQEPFAAVLACADSRVPIELVFDQTIGHLFVTRVAGNIVTPEIMASLEYAVAVLGVKVLLVLGHTGCGAVKAAMKADPVPGQISVLYQHIQSAVELSGGDVGKAIANNAKLQAHLLRTSSTVVREALQAAKVRVESGVYDLATGKVTLQG
jgi:carbonic anhydrase